MYTDLKFVGDAVIEKRERRGKKKLHELERNSEVGGHWRRKAEADGTLKLRQERATTKILRHLTIWSVLRRTGTRRTTISLSDPVIGVPVQQDVSRSRHMKSGEPSDTIEND